MQTRAFLPKERGRGHRCVSPRPRSQPITGLRRKQREQRQQHQNPRLMECFRAREAFGPRSLFYCARAVTRAVGACSHDATRRDQSMGDPMAAPVAVGGTARLGAVSGARVHPCVGIRDGSNGGGWDGPRTGADVPLCTPDVTRSRKSRYVVRAMRSGWVAPAGRGPRRTSRRGGQRGVGVEHAVAVSSGTAALPPGPGRLLGSDQATLCQISTLTFSAATVECHPLRRRRTHTSSTLRPHESAYQPRAAAH